ncbi:MAG TPA: transglutaminase family protein [Burkholderiaceae bacterium]|nr:transglutaminase family protein [Burkholderiaceae bacterium]
MTMRLSVRHETLYVYSSPFFYSIQQLRLTPRNEPHQVAIEWNIAAPAKLETSIDAFGNEVSTFTLARSGGAIRVLASGVVEVHRLDDGRVAESTRAARVSPLVFSTPTTFTQADERIADFASQALDRSHGVDRFLNLASKICEDVRYTPGVTHVASTASQALALQRGVCQDHAHVFLAVCRLNRVPCRYVSGYFYPGERPELASHAWADVWLEDTRESSGGRWVSIDITHRCFASERYIRLAVGRDYESAAPIRGVRAGGGQERMTVNVSVTPT